MKQLVCAAVTAILLGAGASFGAAPECTLYVQESFPHGAVWFRITGPMVEVSGLSSDTALDLATELLVSGVRSDGVLVQNKQARYPRLVTWKTLGKNEISTDGRRTWHSGCSARERLP
jgi:hypothetical protein